MVKSLGLRPEIRPMVCTLSFGALSHVRKVWYLVPMISVQTKSLSVLLVIYSSRYFLLVHRQALGQV